jgi:hypothetical protein
MTGVGAFMRRSRAHTSALIVAVVASGLVLGGLAVVRAAQIEAETRATLLADLELAQADLDAVAERSGTAQTLTVLSQSCIDAEVARLRPAISAPARFSPAVVVVSTALTSRAAVPAAAGAEASVALVSTGTDAGVDELRTALAELHELRVAQGSEATLAMLLARERAAACDTARSAVTAAVVEVAARTDAVVAANGLASPESIGELRAAAAAVQAGDGVPGNGAEALPRWVAAVAAVEAAQASGAAAKAAEEAAAGAASEPGSSDAGAKSTGPPAPLPQFAGRQLTPEEVAALGMPPGSIIYEYTGPTPPPPPLG